MNVAAGLMGGLGWPELLIIVFVLMLLFGAKKLPDMARGTGRALRIFKAETKGLMEDDDDDVVTPHTTTTPGQITQTGATAAPVPPVVAPPAPVQAAAPPVVDITQQQPTQQPLPPTHTET